MEVRYLISGIAFAVLAVFLVDRFWYPVPASLYGVRLGLTMAGVIIAGFAIGCLMLWALESIGPRAHR